jgi:hypothetical protein
MREAARRAGIDVSREAARRAGIDVSRDDVVLRWRHERVCRLRALRKMCRASEAWFDADELPDWLTVKRREVMRWMR